MVIFQIAHSQIDLLHLSFRFHQGAFVCGIHDHNDKSAHLPSVCHSTHVSHNEVSDKSSDSSYAGMFCQQLEQFVLFFCRVQYVCLFRQFKKAVTDAIMSRRAIRNMNTLWVSLWNNLKYLLMCKCYIFFIINNAV